MKTWRTTAALALVGLALAGCVDGERGYNGYSEDYYRPSSYSRSEERREMRERRRERREERRYEQRSDDYGDDTQGPNVIRIPIDDGGY